MNAVDKVYDIGVGTYDVTVSVGPSYQSKRQEAVASQLELVKAFPALMQIAPDIIIRNFDWPQADEIADRAKALLDPRVLQASENKGDPETRLTQLQAQMGTMMQEHQQLKEAFSQAQQIIQTKQVENQGRLEIEKERTASQERVKFMEEETKRYIAEVTTKAQDARERLKLGADLDKQMHVSAHETALSAQEHGQALAQGQQAAQQQSAQSAQQSMQDQAAQQANQAQENQGE